MEDSKINTITRVIDTGIDSEALARLFALGLSSNEIWRAISAPGPWFAQYVGDARG